MKNPLKDMTILPKSWEKWAVQRMMPIFMKAAGRVYSQNNYGQNGRWVANSDIETRLAYDALGKNVWMYSAIYAITTSTSMLPCGVFKRTVSTKGGDYALDEEDNVTKLMERPNPHQTPEEFKELIMWSLELSGKMFIEVVGGKEAVKKGSKTAELYVLDPRRVTVKKDSTKYIVGYTLDVDGEKRDLGTDDVIFHRYCNPADPYEGLAPSTPAGDSINSDINSNEYNSAFFGNSGFPSLILENEKRMDDTEVERLAATWAKTYKGPKKAHKVAVLWGGVKATPMQRSPKDMEFVKQKLLNREEMLAAYGVTPVLVGLLESSNYSNSKEQKKIFWQQTMKPKLTSLAKRFSIEFGLDGFKRKFMFDLTEIDALQEDEEIKSRIAFNLSKSGFSWDEIRKRVYKMGPCEGGVGKYPWVPSNMCPSNLLLNGPIAAPSSSGKPGKPDGPQSGKPGEGTKPDAATTNNKPAKDIELSPKEQELRELIERMEKMMRDDTDIHEKILVG